VIFTRQIVKTDEYRWQGRRAISILQSNPIVSSWINASHPFSPVSIATLGRLSRVCESVLDLDDGMWVTPKILGKCSIAMAEAAVFRVEGG